jgi:hypothetical protein
MNDAIARYEFRAFSQTFGLVAERIRRLSPCESISESMEIYLLSLHAQQYNVKVRGGELDIKQLIEVHEKLERWTPITKQQFPISSEFVGAVLFPALAVTDARLDRDSYTLDALINQIIRPNPGLVRACVFKRRFRFTINTCATEIDELLVNGAAIKSIAVESAESNAVLAVLDELGLGDYEQVNYPHAIRRIIGLETLPDEDHYG